MSRSLRTQFPGATNSPGLLLWHLTNAWQGAQRAALRPFALTHVQFVLLASLTWLQHEEETTAQPTTQRRLAEHAGTDPMMTSQVLRTLETKGLITRRAHPSDARARALQVTPAGQELADRATAAVEDVDRVFFDPLGTDRDAFTHMLQHLTRNDADPTSDQGRTNSPPR